jgi:hypothetical protein
MSAHLATLAARFSFVVVVCFCMCFVLFFFFPDQMKKKQEINNPDLERAQTNDWRRKEREKRREKETYRPSSAGSADIIKRGRKKRKR